MYLVVLQIYWCKIAKITKIAGAQQQQQQQLTWRKGYLNHRSDNCLTY